MQTFKADNFRGKRLRLSAWVKPEIFTLDRSAVSLSGDTAILSGAQTEKVSGEDTQYHLFTHIWVKRDGRWRLLANTQFTDPNRK